MVHGVGWNAQAAKVKEQELDKRKSAIKGQLDGITGQGHRLYSVKSHRSQAYKSLLEARRIAKSSGDKAAYKSLAIDIRSLRLDGKDKELEIGTGLSDTAIKKYLYTTLKLPKQFKFRKDTKGANRTLTADEVALRKLRLTHLQHGELFDLILEHRHCAKMISTYLDPRKIDPADGRFHCMYKPFGTQSGRLSSSESPTNYGWNGQNTDRELKHLFQPDEG